MSLTERLSTSMSKIEIRANDKNQIYCKCNHCGNIGFMEVKGSFSKIYYMDNPFYDYPEELMEYFLLECPVCNKPVLVNKWKNLAGDPIEEYRLSYPIQSHEFKYAPRQIQKSYEESRDLYRKEFYEYCLASLRILLEKIADDKNANGKTLEKKIEDLARSNIIPTTIKDASNVVRQLGNKGAHGKGDNITKTQLDQLFSFIETIISYIYEIPGQLKQMAR